MEIYRQGDILITRVNSIPKGLKEAPITRGRYILAEGELTGHHHSVSARPAGTAVLDRPASTTVWQGDEEVLFLQAMGGAVIEHQEHTAIELPPGTYRVSRQREYAPGEIRRISD